jgi:hypothetical protein
VVYASPFWVEGDKQLQFARKLKFSLRGIGATRPCFRSNLLHTSFKRRKQIYRSNQKNEMVAMATVSSPNSKVLKMIILPILLFKLVNQSINSTFFPYYHIIIIQLEYYLIFGVIRFSPLKRISSPNSKTKPALYQTKNQNTPNVTYKYCPFTACDIRVLWHIAIWSQVPNLPHHSVRAHSGNQARTF